MTDHRIVSREQWLAERRALLEEEKAFTRQRDALSRKRRALPWVKVEADYRFDTAGGARSLADLFAGRSQLLVYHFMFGPEWSEGCPSCSFWADGYDRMIVHLAHRDITLIAVSRAPLAKLDAYKARMGWSFEWVSSAGSDFNFDFHVSRPPDVSADGRATYNYEVVEAKHEELPGASAFYRDADGQVFHTYSTYARGLDMFNAAYHLMDIAPKGRDEADLPWPMAWLRRRDQYED